MSTITKLFVALAVAVVVVLVATVAWKISGQNADQTTSSFTTAQNAAASSSPSAVSEATIAPGTYTESIQTPAADGGTRTYVIHIPTGYSPGKTYPLVLLFHGGYGNGQGVLEETNFAAEADQEGVIVVAPNGVDHHWNNGNGVWNANVNDVDFVSKLIANLESTYPIDPDRIYAAGISDGAGMSEYLAIQMPQTFAAIGFVAGDLTVDLANRYPASPVPVVAIKGLADPIQPVDGGIGDSGADELSNAATMAYWAQADDCDPTPVITNETPTVQDGTSVQENAYQGCKADVVFYLVSGMGHSWPPESAVQAAKEKVALGVSTGPTSQNINATQVFWTFFAAHPK
jgi:polyhydroxybutyrate depolymerase